MEERHRQEATEQTPGVPEFGLTSSQSRLLLALERADSVVALARLMGRDPSVISRQLKHISSIAAVIEKQGGTWRLTSLGRRMNQWTRDAILAQARILRQSGVLRIAATREFASRFLAPALTELIATETGVTLSVLTAEGGVEKLLLAGEADIAFDFGRPQDPMVRFKSVVPFESVAVASPEFVRRHGIDRSDRLKELPFLHYDRLRPPAPWQPGTDIPNVVAQFNDIGVVAEACRLGMGWAVLPRYAVRKELEAGQLVVISAGEIAQESLGVWWTAGRTTLQPWVERSLRWLKTIAIE